MGVIMPTVVSPASIKRTRRLRRGMTDGECKLWTELREFRRWYGIHVRRQAPIGVFVADFVIHEHRLIIEVDGEHHLEPERQRRDQEREEWLAGQGYAVMRFSTGDLSDTFDGCIEEILGALGLMQDGKRTPTPNPSPQGGGEQGSA